MSQKEIASVQLEANRSVFKGHLVYVEVQTLD